LVSAGFGDIRKLKVRERLFSSSLYPGQGYCIRPNLIIDTLKEEGPLRWEGGDFILI
jgi:hypothetical protein